MSKEEEIKYWIRNQIDSSIKSTYASSSGWWVFSYNKSYIRALKLSKITGKTVDKEIFDGGKTLFMVNSRTGIFWCYRPIREYLKINYTVPKAVQDELLKEIINEYEEYKEYTIW